MTLRCPFRLVALTVVAVVAACGPSDKLLGPEPLTGEGLVYRLSDVNSTVVPMTLSSGPPKVEALRGALTLSSDSSWIVSLVFRISDNGQSVSSMTTTRGKYTRSNSAIVLSLQSDTTTVFTGDWTDASVRLLDRTVTDGHRFRFTR